MAIFSLSVKITGASAGPLLEIYTGSSPAMACKVMEIGISQNAATATEYGLGFPAAVGTGRGGTFLFQNEQSQTDYASKTNIATSWSGAPTAPTIALRRFSSSATVGAGIIWTFPRGITIPAGGTQSIVLWGYATFPTLDVWCVLDE